MPLSFYTGSKESDRKDPSILPILKRDKKKETEGYRPDAGLVAAVNVALLLNKPMLIRNASYLSGKISKASWNFNRLGFIASIFATKPAYTESDLPKEKASRTMVSGFWFFNIS